MKKYNTPTYSIKLSCFKVLILISILTLTNNYIHATSIITNAATNIKLATATLGATITPSESVVIERGIFWSYTAGVSQADTKISAAGVSGGAFTVSVS